MEFEIWNQTELHLLDTNVEIAVWQFPNSFEMNGLPQTLSLTLTLT